MSHKQVSSYAHVLRLFAFLVALAGLGLQGYGSVAGQVDVAIAGMIATVAALVVFLVEN
jgi:hypothetical protein